MLMFGEERRCKIPRTLYDRFEHGFQLGEAKMVPQERFDGELGQFRLKRRFDKMGYN